MSITILRLLLALNAAHSLHPTYAGRVRQPSTIVGAAPRPDLASTRNTTVLRFTEARARARALGAADADEYAELRGFGAYALPRAPDTFWAAFWQGWDDWLGVRLAYADARRTVRRLGLGSEAEYAAMLRDGAETERVTDERWNAGHALQLRPPGDLPGSGDADVARLPADPATVYGDDWQGWVDFLGIVGH